MPNVEVKPITQDELSQVKDWIHKHHYIHRWPTGVRYKMGVYIDGKLSGTLLYGPPVHPGAAHEMFKDAQGNPIMQNNQVLELLRAFTTDQAKEEIPNLGSVVVSRGNDFIRKHGESKDGKPIHAILSYADPEAGHSGKVYKATNADYLGPQKGGVVLQVTDPTTGKSSEIHQMSVKQGFGTEKIETLRQDPRFAGKELSWRRTEGKHKYIYALGKDQNERDEIMSHLTAPLYSYPEPGQPSHQIPNEAKERVAKRHQQTRQQQKQPVASKRGIIKKLLQTKIKNPETGNQILVATALRYDKGHPANKTARHIVNAYAQRHGIRVKPSRMLD